MKYYLRGKEKPVPDDLTPYMTRLQELGLYQAEQYGWHLEFVRRPPFKDASIVMANADETSIGVLRKDGTVNTHADIQLRH